MRREEFFQRVVLAWISRGQASVETYIRDAEDMTKAMDAATTWDEPNDGLLKRLDDIKSAIDLIGAAEGTPVWVARAQVDE